MQVKTETGRAEFFAGLAAVRWFPNLATQILDTPLNAQGRNCQGAAGQAP